MELEQNTTIELSKLNAIRVETAFSRYPVHKLARKGNIDIDIREENENGEVTIKWEVDYSKKHGQPGPLAYKLDTLIVNRRIEEATRPIPRIIKLGSLHDICKELGYTEGENKSTIKKALYQNASAFITTKTRFRRTDGSEQTLEAGFSRYSVVFTGEKLPGGQKADAVYLILNDVYLQVINGAMTRPLDYEYLKDLPPVPQRFYELLSYQMYAALKYERPRAKLTYSTLCTYAPQMRYFDWEHARKQMAKVHALHKKSGYIAKAEFQQTTGSDGKPDWLMLYTPGPRARAEFRAFTKRGGPIMLEIEPISIEQDLSVNPAKQLRLDLDMPPLVRELTKREITKTKAVELVEQNPAALIENQIEVYDWLVGKHDKRVEKNPAGYLVTSICDEYKTPKGFISKAEEQRRLQEKQAKEKQAAEKRRQEQLAATKEQEERQKTAAFWDSMTPEQQAEFDAESIAQCDPETLAMEKGPMKRFAQQIRRDEHIRRLLKNRTDATTGA